MSFLLDVRPNMGRQQKEVYSFPPLKTSEIVACVNALGIKMTEAEITEPESHKEQVRRVLEQLAEICTGITRDEMGQIAFHGISALSWPDLHEDSIPNVNSFRACSKMMETCGINDFSTKDFMAPTAKRLKFQLSGIINFAKFREERWAVMTELTSSREDLIERSTSLKEQNEKLASRLASLREQTAEEAKVIARVEGECRAIEATIAKLNQQQAEIREETTELKSFNGSLKEGIAARETQFEEAQTSRKALQGQIVNSPERFRKQIIDVGHALQTEQRDTKTAEKKLRDLSGWLAHVEDAQSEADIALDAMREVRAEVERQKSVVNELKSQQEDSHAKRQVLQELDQNAHQQSRAAARAEEKLVHLRKQSASRATDSAAGVEEVHRQLVEAENFRVQVRARSERSEGEVSRLDREAEAETMALGQEYTDMVASYQVSESLPASSLPPVYS